MNQSVPQLASTTCAMPGSPFNPYQAPSADDAPPSLRKDQRRLHGHIAGTVVVKV
jgi:hypothetical protein